MADDPKNAGILADLRAALADLLSDAAAREHFREKVAAWCKRAVESDKPGAPRVTDVATRFNPFGSPAMVAALVARGPQELDDAYVLLGAIHERGPHVGRVGRVSPLEWHSTAPSPSEEEEHRTLILAQRLAWDNLSEELERLTPEVVADLIDWREMVEKDLQSRLDLRTGAANPESGAQGSPAPRRGPARLPVKEAERYIRWLRQWADVQERDEGKPKRDRTTMSQWALANNTDFGRLKAAQAWYARQRHRRGWPRDPRDLDDSELRKRW